MKLTELQESLALLDAARAAGVHPSTIRRAARRGELDHFRVVGRIRILPADLEAWLFRVYPDDRAEKRQSRAAGSSQDKTGASDAALKRLPEAVDLDSR